MNKLLLILTASIMLAACDQAPTATQIEQHKQELSTMQGVQQVGLPAIVNFQEKRVMKQIMEVRDTKIVTITYITDMNGHLHKICDSIGYGLPYATQYTNPQMAQHPYSGVYYTLPQADPNGLYSPAAADGTWILCANPNKPGETTVLYIEPHVIVSTFPLDVK